MHPAVKAYVKPVVEVMAALPSVVLGFLAGLWLAPMIERIVPGLFLLPLVLPVLILAALLLWQTVPAPNPGPLPARHGGVPARPRRGRWGPGWPSPWAASSRPLLLGGNYRGWLLSALGLTYDQRNSLVVGVAMGFAVIPIIFTIAEDSLANVPQHLRAGRWRSGATAGRRRSASCCPRRSPGIFSAIMIGFGRAVGETMIVLMATGNTPVMDWSIFNGFRALSANIAVELPEAPEGGTLFRVLFLAAFLLFCLTFVVNTVGRAGAAQAPAASTDTCEDARAAGLAQRRAVHLADRRGADALAAALVAGLIGLILYNGARASSGPATCCGSRSRTARRSPGRSSSASRVPGTGRRTTASS